MTDTTLPAPLVAAEVDLRDFVYMPLDVLRLRDSELAATPDAEAFRCSVLAWCVAWHQIPAASLPDDDATLARLLGFGRDLKGWKRIRAADGLRGWIKCADGRLYHPVVAEKARDAWAAKLAQRARTEAARKAREEARQRQSEQQRQPLSQGLSQTPPISVTDPVTESKGEVREREGKGIEIHGSLTGAKARKRAGPPAAVLAAEDLAAEGVDPQHARDWLAVRRAKHLPLTGTAWTDTKAEALKAGVTAAEAVRLSAVNGWAGFRASWLANRDAPKGANGSHIVNRQKAAEAENANVLAEWLHATTPTTENPQ